MVRDTVLLLVVQHQKFFTSVQSTTTKYSSTKYFEVLKYFSNSFGASDLSNDDAEFKVEGEK